MKSSWWPPKSYFTEIATDNDPVFDLELKGEVSLPCTEWLSFTQALPFLFYRGLNLTAIHEIQ